MCERLLCIRIITAFYKARPSIRAMLRRRQVQTKDENRALEVCFVIWRHRIPIEPLHSRNTGWLLRTFHL